MKTKQVKVELTGHIRTIWSVAFNHDGTILASGSDDTTIKLWSIKTLKTIAVLKGRDMVRSVVFNNTGTLLAGAILNKTIKL